MTTRMTRRAFWLAGFGGAAATFGAASARPAAAAAEAMAGAPAMYDVPLGRYRLTAIFDGMIPLGKNLFFGPDQAEIDAALGAAGIAGDTLPVPATAYLLRAEDRTILIDSGFGEVQMFGPGFGRLSPALAAAGVAPQDVDLIIATHAHPDHVGGMLKGGQVAFPEAELVISDVEHGFWSDAGMMARAPDEAKGMFALAQGVFGAYGSRLRPVASGTEVAPGVTLELSPGHTPGHSVLHIDGGERQLLLAADTVLHPDLQTALPDVLTGFDIDASAAAQSRAAIFDRAASDGILIAGSHVHFPGFGRFLRDGTGFRFAPASWL